MIKFLRSLTVTILFVLFGLGALFVRYFIFPFQKKELTHYKTLQKSWKFFIWLMKITKIIEVELSDVEKIKNIKNSIIVSTHPSFVDIVILMSIIPESTCFVAEKLAKNPFFRGMVNSLFILETKDMDNWLHKSLKKLDEGLNIIIFPMGTRHKKNEFLKIRRGASLIAQKSGKNIIMLDIENDFGFLQSKEPFYKAGSKPVKYKISYLKELNTKEYLAKYQDEVDFKTNVTKEIKKTLYKIQK